ncbi:glycosyltransferase family 4 protein [bacterium]|nr:glycosyltransferase family 4 protein [bacterium]
MRLLFVSNYYPPHYIGGYELHCARVAEWMVRRGHEVRVLTSDFRRDDVQQNGDNAPEVCRDLKLRYWTDVASPGYWWREWRDLATFEHHLVHFRPDVVVLWNVVKLASGIVLEAQRRAPRLVYHFMDEWPAEFTQTNGLPQFWARPANSAWGRIVKPLLRLPYRLLFTPDVSRWRPERAVFVSHALKEMVERRGVEIPERHVSWITYEPALFDIDWTRQADPRGRVRFLWAGRVCIGKGLKTTLDALDRLWSKQPEGWTVDFCGPVDPKDDAEIFQPRLACAPWKDRTRYLGALPHSDMPAQYRDHDAFLFTSEVHEGLPGTIIEAFAAGLPVIGTLTGGTKDVLRPGENCLVYEMGNANALADAMLRLIREPDTRHDLSKEVGHFAREKCSNEAVFPELEKFYANSQS